MVLAKPVLVLRINFQGKALKVINRKLWKFEMQNALRSQNCKTYFINAKVIKKLRSLSFYFDLLSKISFG